MEMEGGHFAVFDKLFSTKEMDPYSRKGIKAVV